MLFITLFTGLRIHGQHSLNLPRALLNEPIHYSWSFELGDWSKSQFNTQCPVRHWYVKEDQCRETNLIKKIDQITEKPYKSDFDVIYAEQYLNGIRNLEAQFQQQHLEASTWGEP